LRSNTLGRWTFGHLDIPVTLFRLDEWPADAPDHGWSVLCKRLTVLPVGGNHYSLLESKFRQALSAQFLRAVETAKAFAERKITACRPSDETYYNTNTR
jgi:thioesterase domain-containing protein